MTDLARLASGLATAWGPLEGAPRLVVNRENAVFDVTLETGVRGALRLHRAGYQTADGILSELRWTERLAETGFQCPTPLRTENSDLILQREGAPVASMIGWIDAEPIGAMGQIYASSAETYRDVGALIGALHSATDTIDLTGISRPAWSRETLLGDAPIWGRFWENPALESHEQALLFKVKTLADQALSNIAEPDIGLIHADVLQENILRNDDGLWLIDFDDAGVGYRLYDLGTAMIQHIDNPRYTEISEALVDGYQAARGVTVSQAELGLFTLLRGLASCGWIMSRALPDDPRQRIYAERALRLARAYLT